MRIRAPMKHPVKAIVLWAHEEMSCRLGMQEWNADLLALAVAIVRVVRS